MTAPFTRFPIPTTPKIKALLGTVARTFADWFNFPIQPESFGATGDGVTDDIDALEAMYTAGGKSGNYLLTANYAVSRPWVIDLQWGSLVCRGSLVPAGTYTDYLIKILREPNLPQVASGTLQAVTPSVVRVNGLGQSRGAFLQALDSSFITVHAMNCYGASLHTNTLRESNLICFFNGGYNRPADWLGTETIWNSATAYNIGDYVKREPAAWNATVTYTAAARVTYNGRCWITKDSASNKNNIPDLTSTIWQLIPFEYFVCLISNSNHDPEIYNAFATNPVNWYWEKVFNHEAVLEVSPDQVVGDADNQSRIWVDCHNAGNATLVRIGGTRASEVARGIWIEGHVHAIDGSVITPDPPNYYHPVPLVEGQICVHVVNAYSVAISPFTNMRAALNPGATILMCGCPSITNAGLTRPYAISALGGIWTGEAAGQCGILFMGSTKSEPILSVGYCNFTFGGAAAREVLSPRQSIIFPVYGQTIFRSPGTLRYPAWFQGYDGNTECLRVGIIGEANPRAGWYSNRIAWGGGTTGYDVNLARSAVSIMGLTGGGQVAGNLLNQPSVAVVEFTNKWHAINNVAKFAGRSSWDTTDVRPIYATGPFNVDPWVFSDGTTAGTPSTTVGGYVWYYIGF